MNTRLDHSLLRSGIVAFWGIWFSIVFATNACDGLKELGALPDSWSFASGNYRFMQTVTARYSITARLTGPLFLGVVCWEALAAALFLRAAWQLSTRPDRASQAARIAFATGLALWAAFVIADEIFIAYSVEATHVQLFIAQLLSLHFVERGSNENCGSGDSHERLTDG